MSTVFGMPHGGVRSGRSNNVSTPSVWACYDSTTAAISSHEKNWRVELMVSTTVVLGLTVMTLIGFTIAGMWYSQGRVTSIEDLISARNQAGTNRITATLVASVMGVWILFAAPEAGAGFGVAAVIGYAIGEAVPMYVYSRVGPRIRSLIPSGHSLTEYARARYGTTMYAFVVVVSGLYMFVFVAAELTGIAGALAFVADVPQWQTATLVGGFVLLYTGYGGLRASIFTDTVQAVIVIPLLAVAFIATVFALGGPTSVLGNITAADPALLDPTTAAGFQFGLALAFAILGAELLNQTWWQRIYAGTDSESITVAFRRATILNGFIVFIAAFLGVVATGHADIVTDPASAAYNADVAFFVLLQTAVPEWVIVVVVLLALSLVMSSVDTLFNALSSLITVDLARIYPVSTDRQLRWIARGFTLCIAFAAIYVSVRAQSVLRLFFFADLLGTALAFPLVYGLYSERLTGFGALAGSLSGLAVGLAYFPDLRGFITAIPLVGPVLPSADPLYLTAFGGSFLTSIGVTVIISRLTTTRFDLDTLGTEITRLDEPIADGGQASAEKPSTRPDPPSNDECTRD